MITSLRETSIWVAALSALALFVFTFTEYSLFNLGRSRKPFGLSFLLWEVTLKVSFLVPHTLRD